MSKLLEIGPGAAPAINLIRQVNPDQIVFVGEPDHPISRAYAGIYDEPRFVVSDLGLLEYVRKIARPKNIEFDWIIASNVLNSPGTDLTPYSLGIAVRSILARNGVLRVENTADMFEHKVMLRYKQELERAGYRVETYDEDDPDQFIHRVMITAFGRGIGLIASLD